MQYGFLSQTDVRCHPAAYVDLWRLFTWEKRAISRHRMCSLIKKTIEINLLTSIESFRKVRFITDRETFVSHLFYVNYIHHYTCCHWNISVKSWAKRLIYTYNHLTAGTQLLRAIPISETQYCSRGAWKLSDFIHSPRARECTALHAF